MPEFMGSTAWRKFAAQTYFNAAKRIILPDGFEDELAPGYDQVIIFYNSLRILSDFS